MQSFLIDRRAISKGATAPPPRSQVTKLRKH